MRMSNPILPIDLHLINQIKAGEVIERPSLVLKELIENSIDAGSTEINIRILNGGMSCIEVTDNGCGMDKKSLPLAFKRHYSSKIKNYQDLFHLKTYGFRGEALASIGSVAKVNAYSFDKQKSSGGHIQIEGEHITGPLHYESSINGTKIIVSELFFNTPARLKFLKSKTRLTWQIKNTINAFLLYYPKIKFTIQLENDKNVFPPSNTKKRVHRILYEKESDDIMYHVEKNDSDFICNVYFTKTLRKGHVGKKRYLFVNGRLVEDVAIYHLITQIGQKIWGMGSGNTCIFIELPSEDVDINVHPQKSQVRFYQSGKIYGLIYNLLSTITHQRIKDHGPQYKQQSKTQEGPSINENSLSPPSYPSSSQANRDNFEYQASSEFRKKLKEKLDYLTIFSFESSCFIQPNQEEKILYYVCFKNIIPLYLKRSFETQVALGPIPLLISEPLDIDFHVLESFKDNLENFGLDIDTLDKQRVLLRSVPECLSTFPYVEIIKHFIDFLSLNLKQEFTSVLTKYTQEELKPFPEMAINQVSWQKLFSTLDFKTLIANKNITPITEKTFC